MSGGDDEVRDTFDEFVAFAGFTRIATGDLSSVAAAAWRAQDAGPAGAILIFKRSTGEVIDLDLRGSEHDVAARHARPPSPSKRGRPRLGVVPREVTLLPRHWDWLARQPGGASTTLRKLVEAARKADAATCRERKDAAYRFISGIGGDLVGFEELSRALFAPNLDGLDGLLQHWPADVREELTRWLDRPSLAEKRA
jgi:hypothetical protein